MLSLTAAGTAGQILRSWSILSALRRPPLLEMRQNLRQLHLILHRLGRQPPVFQGFLQYVRILPRPID